MSLAAEQIVAASSKPKPAVHAPAGSSVGLASAAAWLKLRASSAAPSRIGSALELDGYLTGVLVAPSQIATRRWIAGLWGADDPVFDDQQQLAAALESIMARYNALSAEIDASLDQLQAERTCRWRPSFQPADGKPSLAAVRQWAEGFWKAAAFDPAGWSAYAEDERTRIIVTPLVGFVPFDPGQMFDSPDDIEHLLGEAAAAIPHSVLLLRMIAQMRAERPPQRSRPFSVKIGRNDPCPCGSGQKYKRCCAAN
jgi:uncharacterized protein